MPAAETGASSWRRRMAGLWQGFPPWRNVIGAMAKPLHPLLPERAHENFAGATRPVEEIVGDFAARKF
jgi:hypothetical protein